MKERAKETACKTFSNLPTEKQDAIINGALKAFGENGYRKTSVSDIAAAAGISKSMVFHYFGTKKELYLYLADMSAKMILGEIKEKFNPDITDFFDRIILTSGIKISVMKKYPATLSFLTSAYFESDEEIKRETAAILGQGTEVRSQIAFNGVDSSKFKPGVDIALVLDIIVWMAEGFIKHTELSAKPDLDTMFGKYWDCVKLLKNNLYREEFL